MVKTASASRCIYIFIWYIRPLRFVAHERLTKNGRKCLVPTLLSSGCEISLGTRLQDVFTRVPTLHV